MNFDFIICTFDESKPGTALELLFSFDFFNVYECALFSLPESSVSLNSIDLADVNEV